MIGNVISGWLFARKFCTELCQMSAKYLGINLNGDTRAMFAVTQGLWNIRKTLIQLGQLEVQYHERVTKGNETQLVNYEKFLVDKFQNSVDGIDGFINTRTEAYRQSAESDLMKFWDESAQQRRLLPLSEKTVVSRVMNESSQTVPVLFGGLCGDTFLNGSRLCAKSYPVVLSASETLHKHVDYRYNWEVGSRSWSSFIQDYVEASARFDCTKQMMDVCKLYKEFVDAVVKVRICGAGGENKLFPISEETPISHLVSLEDGGGNVDGDALCHIVKFTEKWHGTPITALGAHPSTGWMIESEHHSRDNDIITSHDTFEFPTFLGDLSDGMSMENDKARNWILSRIDVPWIEGPDLHNAISKALRRLEVSLARMCAFGRMPIKQTRGAIVHLVATRGDLQASDVAGVTSRLDQSSKMEEALATLKQLSGKGRMVSREDIISMKQKYILKIHALDPIVTNGCVDDLLPLIQAKNIRGLREKVEEFCREKEIVIEVGKEIDLFEFVYIFVLRYWTGYHEYYHVPSFRCVCLTSKEEEDLKGFFSKTREAKNVKHFIDVMESLESAMMASQLTTEKINPKTLVPELYFLHEVVFNGLFSECCPTITVDKVGSVVHWLKHIQFERMRASVEKSDVRVIVKTEVDLSPEPREGRHASISKSRWRMDELRSQVKSVESDRAMFKWCGKSFRLDESLRDLFYSFLCEWKELNGTLLVKQRICLNEDLQHRLFFIVDGDFAPEVCNMIGLIVMKHLGHSVLPHWRCFVHTIDQGRDEEGKEIGKFQRFVVVFPSVMVKPDQMDGLLDEIDVNPSLGSYAFNCSIYREGWVPLYIAKPFEANRHPNWTWILEVFKSDCVAKFEAFDLVDLLVEVCPFHFLVRRRDAKGKCSSALL
jgi:hypothetical protein